MAGNRHFGSVPGVPVGSWFPDRRRLSEAGVHAPNQAGISGSQHEGSDSIVLNGGYEDDVDLGDEVIYTGQGGNDPSTTRQIDDQALVRGNRALARSYLEHVPVRVTRGWRNPGEFSPRSGYRYDGIYRVNRYWAENGRSGFRVWRFHLVRIDPAPPPWRHARPLQAAESAEPYGDLTSDGKSVEFEVKAIHDYTCQFCGLQLQTRAGSYAETSPIRPIERPHFGSQSLDNVLCLCPNHRVLFNAGALVVGPDSVIYDVIRSVPVGNLRTHPAHPIDRNNLAYHRHLFVPEYRRPVAQPDQT